MSDRKVNRWIAPGWEAMRAVEVVHAQDWFDSEALSERRRVALEEMTAERDALADKLRRIERCRKIDYIGGGGTHILWADVQAALHEPPPAPDLTPKAERRHNRETMWPQKDFIDGANVRRFAYKFDGVELCGVDRRKP